RAGWCTVDDPAKVAWHTSILAHPARQAVIVATGFGEGRVVVVTDSVLFGDERITQGNHAQLWLNILYWLAGRQMTPARPTDSASSLPPGWLELKSQVNELRPLQEPDGSVPALHRERA